MRSLSELPNSDDARTSDAPPTEAAPADESPPPFAEVVRSESRWVWRLLRRLGLSPPDADDATQQVFLVYARRGAELRSRRARPFLYGTALRVASNALRSRRRRREVPNDELGSAHASEPPLDELLEQRRARALLDELLAELPPELRRVLVLSEIEQLTQQQIAELEGIPAGTAASRLRRARRMFFELLERERGRNPFARGSS